MNINNLYGSTASTPATSIAEIGSSQSRVSSMPPPGGAATASISGPAQFFSDLQQLSEQDPAKFKAVAAQLATSFQNAASQASGPEAKFLSSLANQFSQAAQTGSLQAPTSPQGGSAPQAVQGTSGAGATAGPHHHHHHGGSMGAGTQSSEVQQAFQNAMNILTQALQGSNPAWSPSTPASTT